MNRICRAVMAALAAVAVSACGSGGLFKQYEYEEDIYLSLDGTAVIYVNSSVAALDALRGAALDTRPSAPLDREAVRRLYTTPVTRVAQISQSRRGGRRFVHVRVDVDDVRRLGTTPPFNWAHFDFRRQDDVYIYQESIGASANRPVGDVGWNGSEVVAFRLHLPSKITYHTNNNGRDNYLRGNILLWEQPLAARLHGDSLLLDARMQTQSILYRTLYLFGATFVAVALTFALVIVLVFRGGKKPGRAGTPGRAGQPG